MTHTSDLRIKASYSLLSPVSLFQELPITESTARFINDAREQVQNIIHGRDRRLLVIVGPCSIHDPAAAEEYASRLKVARDRYADTLCIVMRVYFEKPRTQVGWKGLINDPYLDDSFQINHGLRTARALLLTLNQMGIPTGSEFLDTSIPQYISDLTTWSAIGARTSESQIHRELASGLSMPVGFKNGTTGNVDVAIDAILAASSPHHFLGVSREGLAAILSTTGNPDCHIILRGSSDKTNYDAAAIADTVARLQKQGLSPRVMVDCSHGNSQKDYKRQMAVLDSLCEQIQAGSQHILGLMIESNLVEGKQALVPGKKLNYGQSITDACVSWTETEQMLEKLAKIIA